MEALLFEKNKKSVKGYSLPELDVEAKPTEKLIPEKYLRKNDANLPELSENEVARHFVKISHLNYNIEEGMYPLGSCTMKYNPKVNEKVAGLPGFAEIHPNARVENAQGALQVMYELGEHLKEITGMQGVSLQPAAGSQGELTGILMFRAYHHDRGDTQRKTILIPDSAHGTNPASGAMCGFKVKSVKSNEHGRVDLDALREMVGEDTAGFMLTNPNTVGIFERDIMEIEKIVHDAGGLMYMDGANMNALMGITRPGDMNFDVVHLNLHKTFSTPHGGGGPGSGPVCVNDKLKDFLPVPIIVKNGEKFELDHDQPKSIGKIHSFFGNFGMHIRALSYIRLNGAEGLRQISENAVINANYLLSLIRNDFVYPYTENCMHEFVISGDKQKELGVSTKDIAKRILDYNLHAPTIYFPLIVHEAMLVEPTETETKESIDTYAEAMIKIAREAESNPDVVTSSPHYTPVKRLDDALAARQLNVRWKPEA